MFGVIFPLSYVLVTVRENHGTISIFLTGFEVSVVAAPILIGQLALTFEQVLGEVSFVCTLGLGKVVDTLSLEDAIYKVTFIEAAIGPFVASTTVFLALEVLAIELDLSLLPSFLSEAVLMVVHPISFISGALRVDESSATIGHTISPLSLINATVGLNHAT